MSKKGKKFIIFKALTINYLRYLNCPYLNFIPFFSKAESRSTDYPKRRRQGGQRQESKDSST